MTASAATAPAVAAEVRTDVRNTMDAREKLQAALTALGNDRATALTNLLKQVAKDLAAAAKADPDRLFGAYKTWKGKDERIAERIAVITDLHARIEQRVEEFKAQPALREQMAEILRARIAALKESKGTHDRESGAVQAQIRKLQEELEALGYPATTGPAKGKGA